MSNNNTTCDVLALLQDPVFVQIQGDRHLSWNLARDERGRDNPSASLEGPREAAGNSGDAMATSADRDNRGHPDRGKTRRISLYRFQNCHICDKLEFCCYPAPCSHYYCGGCLRNWVSASLSPGGNFPPSCCGREMDDVERNAGAVMNLTPKLLDAVREKKLERSTPNPLYCASPDCGRFVPPANIRQSTGVCREGHKTCAKCRTSAHSRECPRDPDVARLKTLAQSRLWQRCRCGQYYARTGGCNHMICTHCKFQFCYRCGSEWKPNSPCH